MTSKREGLKRKLYVKGVDIKTKWDSRTFKLQFIKLYIINRQKHFI